MNARGRQAPESLGLRRSSRRATLIVDGRWSSHTLGFGLAAVPGVELFRTVGSAPVRSSL